MSSSRHDVQIQVLGPLEVRVDGELRRLTGDRRRALLALLALHAGSVVEVDRLVDMLWGGQPPATATRSLRVHISQLRKVLDPADVIRTAERGYVLDVPHDSIDLYRFREAASRGRSLLADRTYSPAIEELRRAQREWAYPPLPDVANLSAVAGDIAQLTGIHDALDVNLAEAELQVAGSAADVAHFERLVRDHPYEERAWGLLMKALYWAGNQSEALRVYERAAATFGEELGLEPGPELRRLEEGIFAHDPALAPPTSAPFHLPSFPTRFIGREEQVEQVAKLVVQNRLVSIVGLGGAGKTRLAVEAAGSAATSFQDGVVFATLEHIADPELVLDPLATRFGTDHHDLAALTAAISDKRILLVLDNCEHLVGAAAQMVSTLLHECPSVSILTSSRIPLNVVGETTWVIPPLDVPESGAAHSPGEVESSDAAALFVDRARLARPDFMVDVETAPTIAEISRRLAGIPLAIELAAARCDVLSPGDILRWLEKAVSEVTSKDRDRQDRHQTMDTAVRWSLDLLSPTSQQLLARTSVFHGDFDLAAIEAVCGIPPISRDGVRDELSALASASLVQVETSGDRSRFSLLPPVREVAAQLLDESGEQAAVTERHMQHFASVAGRASQTGSPDVIAAFEAVDDVLDDVRAAVATAADRDAELAIRMCIDLGHYWMSRRLTDEGRRWLNRLLDATDLGSELEAAARHTIGTLAFDDGDLDEARVLLEQALAVRRELDDRRALASTLNNLGGVTSDSGEHDLAHDHYLAALEVFEEVEFDVGVAVTRINLGIVTQKLDRPKEAERHLATSLDQFRRLGDRGKEAVVLERLAHVVEARDPARAKALTRAAHEIHAESGEPHEVARSHLNLAMRHHAMGEVSGAVEQLAAAADQTLDHGLYDPWWVPALFETAGAIADERGEDRLAVRLFGLAESHRRRHDLPESQQTVARLDDRKDRLRSTLGRSDYSEEYTVGESMSSRATLELLSTCQEAARAG